MDVSISLDQTRTEAEDSNGPQERPRVASQGLNYIEAPSGKLPTGTG